MDAIHIARVQDFVSKTIREATKKYIGAEHDDSILAIDRIRTAKALTQRTCDDLQSRGVIDKYIVRDVDEDKMSIVIQPVAVPQYIEIT